MVAQASPARLRALRFIFEEQDPATALDMERMPLAGDVYVTTAKECWTRLHEWRNQHLRVFVVYCAGDSTWPRSVPALGPRLLVEQSQHRMDCAVVIIRSKAPEHEVNHVVHSLPTLCPTLILHGSLRHLPHVPLGIHAAHVAFWNSDCGDRIGVWHDTRDMPLHTLAIHMATDASQASLPVSLLHTITASRTFYACVPTEHLHDVAADEVQPQLYWPATLRVLWLDSWRLTRYLLHVLFWYTTPRCFASKESPRLQCVFLSLRPYRATDERTRAMWQAQLHALSQCVVQWTSSSSSSASSTRIYLKVAQPAPTEPPAEWIQRLVHCLATDCTPTSTERPRSRRKIYLVPDRRVPVAWSQSLQTIWASYGWTLSSSAPTTLRVLRAPFVPTVWNVLAMTTYTDASE